MLSPAMSSPRLLRKPRLIASLRSSSRISLEALPSGWLPVNGLWDPGSKMELPGDGADPDETCELRTGAARSCKHSVIKSFRRMLVEKGSILGLETVPQPH